MQSRSFISSSSWSHIARISAVSSAVIFFPWADGRASSNLSICLRVRSTYARPSAMVIVERFSLKAKTCDAGMSASPGKGFGNSLSASRIVAEMCRSAKRKCSRLKHSGGNTAALAEILAVTFLRLCCAVMSTPKGSRQPQNDPLQVVPFCRFDSLLSYAKGTCLYGLLLHYFGATTFGFPLDLVPLHGSGA
jgi:hypothetical protein